MISICEAQSRDKNNYPKQEDMSKRDICYINGYRCALKEYYVRYVEGRNIPKNKAVWWFMSDCGDDRIAYINID